MMDEWISSFPNCEPVAHHLPLAFPERWVRFHSLPGSKRYADCEEEYATIINRHNEVLGQLARPGEQVALLTTGWSGTAEPVRFQPELLELDPTARAWRTVAMHEQPDNFPRPSYWHIFVSSYLWSPGSFDSLVRLVADDVLGNVMIVATNCRWLLHPYDGGMDVIAESSVERNRLAAFRPEWLAPEWLLEQDSGS
jgi:hypothetical protein